MDVALKEDSYHGYEGLDEASAKIISQYSLSVCLSLCCAWSDCIQQRQDTIQETRIMLKTRCVSFVAVILPIHTCHQAHHRSMRDTFSGTLTSWHFTGCGFHLSPAACLWCVAPLTTNRSTCLNLQVGGRLHAFVRLQHTAATTSRFTCKNRYCR